MFTPVPHITSYHHFRCMHTDPGHVFVREFADSEETNIVFIRPNVAISKTALPSTLTPPGLSEERKQYLFQQIRPYCDEKYRDITCPQPRVQKRTVQQDSEIPPTKLSKRLCSHCRMSGHTKTKKGVITCPELLSQ